jgi:5-formyltetrahydrofolate cyclo-ligase
VLKIFGPKREEDRSWRKLHNDELHSLYSSLNIVRVIKARRLRWMGHVACIAERRGVYRGFKGKIPLRKPRRRWEEGSRLLIPKLVTGYDAKVFPSTYFPKIHHTILLPSPSQVSK